MCPYPSRVSTVRLWIPHRRLFALYPTRLATVITHRIFRRDNYIPFDSVAVTWRVHMAPVFAIVFARQFTLSTARNAAYSLAVSWALSTLAAFFAIHLADW